MITRGQAIAYLDRITEARKKMETPLFPELPAWSGDQACVLFGGTDRSILVDGAEKLAKALNRPAVLRSFSETADVLEFHWNGCIIRDLYCGKRKRIKHIE